MLEAKAWNTIKREKLFQAGDQVVVGLSGGPDSVSLFCFLNSKAKELEIDLFGVHVNHGLRGEEADQDQIYVESLARDLGVPCYFYSYDCEAVARQEGLGTEEAGRNLRYQAFTETALSIGENLGFKQEDYGRIKIALAQNKNDQVETVLIRLLRGTGTEGLAAIDYKRPLTEISLGYAEGDFHTSPLPSEIQVVRPLLDVSRDEIEGYCENQGLTPRIDATNLEPMYFRNKVRLNLIPYLEQEFNPNVGEALLRLSKVAKEDRAFLRGEAEKCYRGLILHHPNQAGGGLAQLGLAQPGPVDSTGLALDLKGLQGLAPAIGSRVIMLAFENLGLVQDISMVHLDSALELIAKGRTGSMVDFPKGYILRISYNKVILEKRPEEIPGPGSGQPDSVDYGAAPGPGQSGPVDSGPGHHHALQDQAVWRTRLPGDYIVLKSGGRKKIQDLFIDKKIPREERDSIPLLCIGHKVIEIKWR